MPRFYVPQDDELYHDRLRCIISDNLSSGSSDPVKLLPHIFIGSQMHAESLKLLRRLGITHVLNCGAYDGPAENPDPYQGLDITYKEFRAKDKENYDITRHFVESFNYLDQVRRRSGVALVHCAMGINRSAAVCVAYVMMTRAMPLLEAVDYVSRKRRVILSNEGFRRQLVRFARSKGLLDKLEEPMDDNSRSSQEREVFPDRLLLDYHPRYNDEEGMSRYSGSGTAYTGSAYSDVKPPSGRSKLRALPPPVPNGPGRRSYRALPPSSPSLSRSRSHERSSPRARSVSTERTLRSGSTERTVRSLSSERTMTSSERVKPVKDYAVMFLYNRFLNSKRVT